MKPGRLVHYGTIGNYRITYFKDRFTEVCYFAEDLRVVEPDTKLPLVVLQSNDWMDVAYLLHYANKED